MSLLPTLARPTVRARFAPVYWEPLVGSGEKVCVIVLLAPELDSTSLLSPGAHVVINQRRLRAMVGAERAESITGILRQATEFMRARLFAGAELTECQPPFKGFEVGRSRLAKGFTAEQVVDAAVRTVAAFGQSDEALEDTPDATNHSTTTTREFLARVQTAFAPADDPRRKRFLRPVKIGKGAVTIDYVYQRTFVQFASAPGSSHQLQYVRREAESKILESISVNKALADMKVQPVLLINTMPLIGGGLPDGAEAMAAEAMAHYTHLAALHDVTTLEAGSHEEAVRILAEFG